MLSGKKKSLQKFSNHPNQEGLRFGRLSRSAVFPIIFNKHLFSFLSLEPMQQKHRVPPFSVLGASRERDDIALNRFIGQDKTPISL